MQGQGGGAPMWSIALHWVHRPLGFPGAQAKVSPHLCFAWGHPTRAIKQSETAATCGGLRDSQVKPSCESRLSAACARPGVTEQEGQGLGLIEASCCLFERI